MASPMADRRQTPRFLHACSFCALIEEGRLQEVQQLLRRERDPCRCWCQRQVYRLMGHYQRLLRGQGRAEGLAKGRVWRSPAVYPSPARALVLQVCAQLLAAGVPLNYTTGVETPLMAALSTCDEELLWLLLENKADVNLCDGVEDMNALGLAILLNEVVLVEILLKHGAKVNALCCGHLVPIQLAMNKNAAVSNLLMQYGADLHQLRAASLHDRVFTSQFPLHVAILRRNAHLARLLLEHGEDVDQAFNDTLEAPIHQAVRNLDLPMVELLVQFGADLNRPTAERHTPVGLALVMEDPLGTQIAKRLVQAGASPNQRTRISYFQKTYSPLHIACFKGNLDFVRFLVEEVVCQRAGFWEDEEWEPAAAATAAVPEGVEEKEKKEKEEKGGGKGAGVERYPVKVSQERYFRLLRRNERLWGSTPSSSSSSSSSSSCAAAALPFQAEAEDYRVRSELSPSRSAPGGGKVGEGGGGGECGARLAGPRSGSGSAQAAGGSRAAASCAVREQVALRSGGRVCSACRDSRNSPGASAAPYTSPATGGDVTDDTDADDNDADADKEAHNMVFVIGDQTMQKPTRIKEQWLVAHREDCEGCCEFCLSPEVVNAAKIVVSHGTQTERDEDDEDEEEEEQDSEDGADAISGKQVLLGTGHRHKEAEQGLERKVQQDGLPEGEGGEEEGEEAGPPTTVVTLAPQQQLSHRATQTHTPAQPSRGVRSGETTTTTTTTDAAPLPVFQAEFGSPDYVFPSPPPLPPAQKGQGSRGGPAKVERGGEGGGGEGGGEGEGGGSQSAAVAAFLNQVGNDGSTALFMAVYDGNVQLVDYLLRSGADPFFSSQHGNFFHAAVLSQSLPLLRRALRLACRINEVNLFGNSPLTLVSRLDLPEACELLVSHGADMNCRDRYGETPLLASVYFGCEMNARTLIQHGAALDLVDDNHTSAIYWSIFNNRQRTLKLLLMAGATFTPRIFRQYPRNIRVMNNRPLFRFIQHFVHQPRSLQDLATICIRTHLGEVNEGRSILKGLDLLPIPNRLKEILRLKHFIDVIEMEAKAENSCLEG